MFRAPSAGWRIREMLDCASSPKTHAIGSIKSNGDLLSPDNLAIEDVAEMARDAFNHGAHLDGTAQQFLQ